MKHMAGRKKHSAEDIVRKLRRADELAAAGKTNDEIAADLEVSPTTLYNWRRSYGGMDVDAAKELLELREQNSRPPQDSPTSCAAPHQLRTAIMHSRSGRARYAVAFAMSRLAWKLLQARAARSRRDRSEWRLPQFGLTITEPGLLDFTAGQRRSRADRRACPIV